MKHLIHEFRDFLLQEGVLEKETTDISRQIINKFKKLVQAGTIYQSRMPFHWMEASVPGSLKDIAPVNSIQVKVTVPQSPYSGPHAQRPTRPVNINAAFGTLQRVPRTLYINITVNKEVAPTSKELLQSISSWLPTLKSLIRHELEHARQSLKKDKKTSGSEQYQGAHFGKGFGRSRKEAMEYLNSAEEREAYISGLYKESKMKKQPFSEVFADWLSSMRFRVLMMKPAAFGDLDDSEIQKMFAELEDDYLTYARGRFPEAQITLPSGKDTK